eukprot:gene19731-14331_t
MKLFREKLNLVLNDVVKGSLRDGVLTIAYGNLFTLSYICDQVKQSIKSLQPMQVIQDVRKGLQTSSCVFGFWKSEYSSQYQLHFVFAVDHIELENEETFAPLLISVTTVTDGDYRVDYTMSNLSE